MNDETNDEESVLDDLIESAIRDVPPADPDVRERHITVALAELSGQVPRPSRFTAGRWAVAAAAAIVMVGAGFSLGRTTSNPATGLAGESGTSVPDSSLPAQTPVKGNAPSESSVSSDAQISAGAPNRTNASPCDDTIGLDPIARFQTEQGWRIAYVRDVPATTLLIVDEASCTVLQEIDLP